MVSTLFELCKQLPYSIAIFFPYNNPASCPAFSLWTPCKLYTFLCITFTVCNLCSNHLIFHKTYIIFKPYRFFSLYKTCIAFTSLTVCMDGTLLSKLFDLCRSNELGLWWSLWGLAIWFRTLIGSICRIRKKSFREWKQL